MACRMRAGIACATWRGYRSVAGRCRAARPRGSSARRPGCRPARRAAPRAGALRAGTGRCGRGATTRAPSALASRPPGGTSGGSPTGAARGGGNASGGGPASRSPGRRGDAAVTGPYGASLKPRLRWGSLLRVNDIGEFLEPRVCSALNIELGERLRAQQLHESFRLADAQLPSLLQYHVKHFRVSLRRTVCRQHRSGDAGYWHINGGLTKKFVLNAFPCPVQGSSILYFQSRYLGHKSIQHRGGTRT